MGTLREIGSGRDEPPRLPGGVRRAPTAAPGFFRLSSHARPPWRRCANPHRGHRNRLNGCSACPPPFRRILTGAAPHGRSVRGKRNRARHTAAVPVHRGAANMQCPPRRTPACPLHGKPTCPPDARSTCPLDGKPTCLLDRREPECARRRGSLKRGARPRGEPYRRSRSRSEKPYGEQRSCWT